MVLRFQSFTILSDYLSRPDHNGGIAIPGQAFLRQDGTEHTLECVPLPKVLQGAESLIKNAVPEDKRSAVFQRVMADMPGRKAKPDWEKPEKPLYNPHATLAHPYSASKAEKPKSNAQILEDLNSSANLNPGQAKSIWIQIAWRDSVDEDGTSGTMRLAEGVHGGRLGRDVSHTLEDIPNNYMRDQIMDYINDQVAESKRADVRKAVFDDLTTAEIEKYSACVAKERKDKETADLAPPANTGSKQTTRTRKRLSEDERIDALGGGVVDYDDDLSILVVPDDIRSRAMANKVDQEAVLDQIPHVDLTLRPDCGYRDDDYPDYIPHSVVTPGLRTKLPVERDLVLERKMDRDFDQVRTMIKEFTSESDWTVDDFRLALFGVERKQLTTFLEKIGPQAGNKSIAYALSWEFFKRREQLGLWVPGGTTPSSGKALQEVDANRRRALAEDAAAGKQTKRARYA